MKQFTEEQVREMLEAARTEIRNHISSQLLVHPLLKGFDRDTVEMCSLLVRDTVADSHFPPMDYKKIGL